jgi:hypothetical protein
MTSHFTNEDVEAFFSVLLGLQEIAEFTCE